MESHAKRLKICVVGGGIAGVAASHLLSRRHDVSLIESNDYVGGHTNTIVVREGEREIPIDTGFIVCNPRTYPLFYALLCEWGVSLRDSDMSFGYSCERTGMAYVGPTWREAMRKPSTLADARVLAMIAERLRFNRRAASDLESGALNGLSLGEYLDRIDASPTLLERYLIPLSAAVWSSPDADMRRFPASSFVRFFENHGMLDLNRRPTWQTVVGGSHTYVKAFLDSFNGCVRTNSPVRSIRRDDDGVEITIADQPAERFDRLVLATHADVSLALLDDATSEERDALSAWTYHPNHAQLHTDASVMPADRRLWASWNYRRRVDVDPNAPVPITYYMNRLQGLSSSRDYLVSLNATDQVDPAKVIHEVEYSHPCYTPRSIDAQERLRQMNGRRLTYFCGAYMRYGFHEDAVASAVDAARHFGIEP